MLPSYTPNTPTYTDDLTSTGWSVTDGAISTPSSGVVRLTQSGTTQANAVRAVTMPVVNRDWIIYGKVRGRKTAGDTQIIHLRSGSYHRAQVLLNFNAELSPQGSELGTISVRYIPSNGAQTTSTKKVAMKFVDTDTEWVEFALHYDSEFSALEVQFRQCGGPWRFGAHVSGAWFAGDLCVSAQNSTTGGSWIEWSKLELVAPDIMAIRDSGFAGTPGYNPNPSLNRNDGYSAWMNWAHIYPENDNTLIVNRGIGGETSAQTAARVPALMACGPKVVFLGAGGNDFGNGVTQAQRKANIQGMVDGIVNGGAACVLVNGSYAGKGYSPGMREYQETSWNEHLNTMTGVSLFIDPMTATEDCSGYVDPAYLHTDNAHYNVAGYAAVGKYIAEQ